MGLTILGAAYGTLDVTSKVQQMVNNDVLEVTADNTTFGDPWVNVRKTLVVVYRDGTPSARVCYVEQGCTITLKAITPSLQPEVAAPRKIYGAAYGLMDVTSWVRDLVRQGRLTVTANNRTFGDSWPGHEKSLVVVYEKDGKPTLTAVKENEPLDIETGPRLKVLAAAYGPQNSTNMVRARIDDNDEIHVTANDTNFLNSWPGNKKTLVVTYQYGNEQPQMAIIKEGDDLNVTWTPHSPFHPATDPQQLQILSAAHGLGDVTALVAGLVRDNALSVRANDKIFPDTWKGVYKTLVVTYQFGQETPVMAFARLNERVEIKRNSRTRAKEGELCVIHPQLPKIWYGGDYSPDQWPRAIWDEDMRLFKLAHIDVATLPVFSWAKLQPEEERYDFAWLDEALDLLARNSIHACLATSTAAHPAWLARRYPDVLRVDFEGRQHRFGMRHNSCPNSPTYRQYSVRLAAKLAERYRDHPTLVAWHVSNEYGGYCYCDNCARAFRVWLQKRYGSLDEVNRRWNTGFWGHTFYDWDEIVPPSALSEHWAPEGTAFQGISLDYNRFQSDSLLECYRLEYEAIKQHTPNVWVTTNLMGAYKPLNYFAWGRYMDIVSWDSYPQNDGDPASVALRHDLMRGLKGGQPFMLMEQTPSQTNWAPYNGLKRPGVLRLWSYQAVAHGADTVMYFQLRQSQGAMEKFHGAVISHAGHEQTRVFREVAGLGAELAALGDALIDARTEARVALLFDWENWWALEFSSGPSQDLKYLPQVEKYYRACWNQNIGVDLVSPDMPLDSYDVLIAPAPYLLQPGFAAKVEAFVARGGTFVTTFMSGMVDENDRVVLGGYPGELRQVTGIWAEEFDPLFPGQGNAIVVAGGAAALHGTYAAGLLCMIIHAETAEVVGVYGDDFYAGTPAVTRNRFGAGWAWYVATDPEQAFVDRLIGQICAERGIQPPLQAPRGVEVTQRTKAGRRFTFVLNHNQGPAEVDLGPRPRVNLLQGESMQGKVLLPGRDLLILAE